MCYVFGDYVLDTLRYELRRAGAAIPLRPRGFQVLAYLLTHHDRVVLKQELLEHLWPGQYVGDAALNSAIMEVRKALGDDGHNQRFLRTIRGRGYRFVAPVELQGQMPSADPALAVHPLAAKAGLHKLPPTPPAAGSAAAADPAGPAAPRADGEYKPVSVLCCALADAPALTAQLGPEGLYHLLDIMVGSAQEVLQAYEGTLMALTSDGFTAVFGAPVAQEDHARRAVLAALDLRHRLRQHPTPRTLTPGALAVRMGLHSGLVVAEGLGQDPQQLYTAVGTPAQLAMRLPAASHPRGDPPERGDLATGAHGGAGCPQRHPRPGRAVHSRAGVCRATTAAAARGRCGSCLSDRNPLLGTGAGAGAFTRPLSRGTRGAGAGGRPGRGVRLGQDPAPDRILPQPGRTAGDGVRGAVSVVRQGEPVPPGARHCAAGLRVGGGGRARGTHRRRQATAPRERRAIGGGRRPGAPASGPLGGVEGPGTAQSRGAARPDLCAAAAPGPARGAAAAACHGGGRPALDRRHLGSVRRIAVATAGGCLAAAGSDRWAGVSAPLGGALCRHPVRVIAVARPRQPGGGAGGAGPHDSPRRTAREDGGARGGQSVLFGGVGMACQGIGPAWCAGGRARDGARGAGGPHGPAPRSGERPVADRRGDRHGGALRPTAGHCRAAGGGLTTEPGASSGRRVPLRDAGGARAHLHVQTRLDPRGRLSVTAQAQPAAPAPAHGAGAGRALSRRRRGAGRTAGTALH